MGLIPIFAAYSEGGNVPVVRGMDYTSPATWKQGAPLVFSSGLVVEASATPTTGIVGISLQPADSAPGFAAANSPTVITGRRSAVSTAIANRINVFGSQFVNNSAVPIAPTQADVGVKYGLAAYSGIWVVDKNLTTSSACVEIIKIDLIKNFVFFKFNEAAIATP